MKKMFGTWQNVAMAGRFNTFPHHINLVVACIFQKMAFFCRKNLSVQKMVLPLHPQIGALAHLVERNTGSVEVSGSSPLCSTIDFISG